MENQKAKDLLNNLFKKMSCEDKNIPSPVDYIKIFTPLSDVRGEEVINYILGTWKSRKFPPIAIFKDAIINTHKQIYIEKKIPVEDLASEEDIHKILKPLICAKDNLKTEHKKQIDLYIEKCWDNEVYMIEDSKWMPATLMTGKKNGIIDPRQKLKEIYDSLYINSKFSIRDEL